MDLDILGLRYYLTLKGKVLAIFSYKGTITTITLPTKICINFDSLVFDIFCGNLPFIKKYFFQIIFKFLLLRFKDNYLFVFN